MARNTFYEFFAGGGMARAGLGDDWQCLFANDFDPKKAAVYNSNWGDHEMWCGDVANVALSKLKDSPDLVWASFPCQDLSLAGNGAGLDGERSGSFWPFWTIVRDLIADGRKPRAIVLENVCGLLTSHQGEDFSALVEAVGGEGYWIGALVADAKDFVPQSRPRLFLIAFDIDSDIPGNVISPYAVDHWHPSRLRQSQAALSESCRSKWLWFAPPIPLKSNTRLIDLIEREPVDVRWHSRDETRRLLDMMSATNFAKVELALQNGKATVGAIYKRTRIEAGRRVQRAEIRFDMAGCLRTPGGGSSRQQLMIIQNGSIRSRLISSRETARLMGLPDDYKLPSRYNDAYHLTGDGVAVPVVRHLARTIVRPVLDFNQNAFANAAA